MDFDNAIPAIPDIKDFSACGALSDFWNMHLHSGHSIILESLSSAVKLPLQLGHVNASAPLLSSEILLPKL